MPHASVARAWVLVALALPLTALAARAQTPKIRMANITVSEGNAGPADAVMTVTLTDPATGVVTVAFATENVDATGGAACGGSTDYVTEIGTVRFSPGETSQPLGVAVCGDTAVEADEPFRVRLSNPVGATIQDATGRVTINNEDALPPPALPQPPPLPTLSIGDVALAEGNAGATNARSVPVTLSIPTSRIVTLRFTTQLPTPIGLGNVCVFGFGDVDAAASLGGPLTFSPGSTAQTIPVSACGDAEDEPNESFIIRLLDPVNATFADSEALVTIVDDDEPPGRRLTLRMITQRFIGDEPRAGERAFATFFVGLGGGPTTQTVSVQFATAPGTARAGVTCVPGLADYLTRRGTLTFSPGTTTQQIDVPICQDGVNKELPETFTVTLSNPVNAIVLVPSGTATIGTASIAD